MKEETKCAEVAFATGSKKTFRPNEWVVDSDASSYMCGNNDFFDEVTPLSGTFVTLADGNVAEVKAKGSGQLNCEAKDAKPKKISLSEVQLILKLELDFCKLADRDRS